MFDETGGDAVLSTDDAVATTPEQPTAADEARALLTDLREAASDGRYLARQYAELLTKAVDDYCGEFEQRAEAVLRRLEEIR